MRSISIVAAVAAVLVLDGQDANAGCPQILNRNYASSLTFTIGTGAFELHGGTDNVHGWVTRDIGGGRYDFEVSAPLGLNLGHRWRAWSIRSVTVLLPGCPWQVDYIRAISLRTAFAGTSDGWTLDSIGVVWNGIGHYEGSSNVRYGILLHIPSDPRSSILHFTGTDPHRVWSHAVMP